MKKLLSALVLSATIAHAEQLPQIYTLHADLLATARDRLAQGDAALVPALGKLRQDADHALQFKPVSVMDKQRTPPSGDKHDYLSQAPYWWPDPAKPDGLPYIRHDGKIYPPSKEGTDAPAFWRMADEAETLGLAYYFTHNEAYAEHAALLIRSWFLDPATHMNPNLDFAQFIPGRNDGRGAGVLETRHLAKICDTLTLIAGSPAWSGSDDKAFRDWLTTYLHWLRTSRNGLDESEAKNNHGSWYDMQTSHIALFLGQTDLATKILTNGLKKRIARQIEPDGRQPLELARTKSLDYCLFNLTALCALADLAEQVHVDWWGYETKDGRSLRGALRYLAPYVDPSKPWPKTDLVEADRDDLLPLFAEALEHGDDPQLRELLAKYSDTPGQHAARWHLLLNMP